MCGTLFSPFIILIWTDVVIKGPEANYSNTLEFVTLGYSLFVFFDKDFFLQQVKNKTLKLPHLCKINTRRQFLKKILVFVCINEALIFTVTKRENNCEKTRVMEVVMYSHPWYLCHWLKDPCGQQNPQMRKLLI